MFWFFNAFQDDPERAVMQLLLVVFSICCHEYMHARAALWQGDDTAARAGHLTLNPLKQMGFFSIFMLLMIGFAFGQVPVDPRRLRRPWGEAIVSFAGPFTNLMLFLFFTGAAILVTRVSGDYVPWRHGWILPERQYFLYSMLLVGAMLNFVLFAFNMVPVPPLDGYGVFGAFFPSLKHMNSEFVKGATLFVFIAVFASARYLLIAGSYVIGAILELTDSLAGVAGG